MKDKRGAARHMLTRHVTRYTYRVGQGEQCAVCGAPRPHDPATGLGWWWHTECRKTTDPEGHLLANYWASDPCEDCTNYPCTCDTDHPEEN